MELSEDNFKQFYIPEGFAHGFLVLSDEAEFCYKCTDFYHPGDEGGLAWNDPEIGVDWPELTGEYKGTASAEGYALADGTPLNLSDKDQLWHGLKDTFHFDMYVKNMGIRALALCAEMCAVPFFLESLTTISINDAPHRQGLF